MSNATKALLIFIGFVFQVRAQSVDQKCNTAKTRSNQCCHNPQSCMTEQEKDAYTELVQAQDQLANGASASGSSVSNYVNNAYGTAAVMGGSSALQKQLADKCDTARTACTTACKTSSLNSASCKDGGEDDKAGKAISSAAESDAAGAAGTVNNVSPMTAPPDNQIPQIIGN